MLPLNPPPLTGDFTFDRWLNLLRQRVIGPNVTSNIIDTNTTIEADTSYVVASYLTINSTLTINGTLRIV